MGFRFSIKWLLGAMVYCAIAAAAIVTQTDWTFSAVLWLAAFLSFLYAALLAFYARGERQARAVGFAVGVACFCLCLNAAPGSVPTSRLVQQFNNPPPQVVYSQPPILPPPAVVAPSAPASSWAPTASYYPPAMAVRPVTISYPSPDAAVLKLRAVNAIATMIAGFVGGALGAMAFRRTRPANGPAVA